MKKVRLYNRDRVEILLTTLWDESVAYGMSQENPVDPTMPRTKANPAHGNDLVAMMADIQRAWKGCALNHKVRSALLLRFGMGWNLEEIGLNQGVSWQAIQQRIDLGVKHITAWLNGDKYEYVSETEEEDVNE